MTLEETINTDLILYMKSKDALSLEVIRMVKGAIQLEKISKKRDLTDEDVISILSKQIKMRQNSIKKFKKGIKKSNRQDLIDQYLKEIELLKKYMPEELTSEEIMQIIDEAFDKVKPQSSKDIGLIMKEVSPKLKGRADMGEVSTIIKEKISNI